MFLISGRVGLVLFLLGVFLSAGRAISAPMAALPIEIVQAIGLLAAYGLATAVVAFTLRSLRWLKQTLEEMGPGD